MQPPPIQQKITEQSGQVDSIWARWFIAMKTAIESASQAVALRWGAITGTLSDQTDLQAALDAKADTTALSGLATTDFVNAAIGGVGADFVPQKRAISTTLPLTGGGDLSADRTLASNVFTGDSGSGGLQGDVPAPAAGDAAANKFLKADATWAVAGSGTVTTTGTPASGELAKFSGASSITNGNLSGDVTTNNTLATEVVGILNKAIDGTSWTDGQILQYQSSPDKLEQVWVVRNLTGGCLGLPVANQPLLFYAVSFPITFPADFANSEGGIDPTNGVNPAATTTFTVKKTSGGVTTTIGTISISTSGGYTFSTTGHAAQSAGTGDFITVINQNPSDNNLEYPFFSLVGFLGATAPSNPVSAGSVSGPGSSTNNDFVMFNGTSGNVLKDNGLSLSTDTTMGGGSPSDSLVSSQKAEKTYIDTAIATIKVIGTATFSASGGSITKLVTAGCISNVTRSSTGKYLVSLSPSQINFAISGMTCDDNSASTSIGISNTVDTSASVSSFTIITATIGSSPTTRDPSFVSVVLSKY